MWDPPRPGLEPVSPASSGRLSTTAPPGKPKNCILMSMLLTLIMAGQLNWLEHIHSVYIYWAHTICAVRLGTLGRVRFSPSPPARVMGQFKGHGSTVGKLNKKLVIADVLVAFLHT